MNEKEFQDQQLENERQNYEAARSEAHTFQVEKDCRHLASRVLSLEYELKNSSEAFHVLTDRCHSLERENTSLRSSLDAANRALADEKAKLFKAGEDYYRICDAACRSSTGVDDLIRQIRETRAKLDKVEGNYAKIVKEILQCDPIPACKREDGNLEPPWEVVARVRAKLEAAEKERDDLKLLHSNLVSAVNELWLQLENWGFIPCNDGWLGAVIKMHAQLTAAQAHVSRLQSDKPFTCFKCGTDGPQMMCPNCANSAAASREAALVMERDAAMDQLRIAVKQRDLYATLADDKARLDDAQYYGNRMLGWRWRWSEKGPAALVIEQAVGFSGLTLRQALDAMAINFNPGPERDAALARCSPPAAETEGQG